MSKLYTVPEMASELDVYPETIRKYIKSFKFVGLFKNMGGKSNVLVYPETEFEMIRDTIEGNKVIEKNYGLHFAKACKVCIQLGGAARRVHYLDRLDLIAMLGQKLHQAVLELAIL